MVDVNNIHWTDDDELLSKFVLHLIPDDEAERLLAHLSTCEHCRLTVETETHLAAGIKGVGRSELKQRLRSQLESREQEVVTRALRKGQIPWTRIASVAAVFAIIISVGVYNRWFMSEFRTKQTPVEQEATERSQTASKPPGPDQDSKRSLGQYQPEKKLAQSREKPGTHISTQPKSAYKEPGKVGFDERSAKEEETKHVASEPGNIAGAQPAAREAQRSNEAPYVTDGATVTQSRQFWVEGHIISGPSAEDQLSQQSGVRIESLAKQEEDRFRSKKDQVSAAWVQKANVPIALKQQLFSTLPMRMQSRLDQTQTVQTSIAPTDSGLEVTLYLDRLVPDSELQSANAQLVKDDSLELTLSNQRIGLALPTALRDTVISKTKR